MTNEKKIIFFIYIILLLFTSCRKDISLPNQELEKLFGTWEWISSSGGFAGITTSHDSVGNTKTIEFTKKGIYKSYKNGDLIEKRKFTIKKGSSIYTSDDANLIIYKENLNKNKNHNPNEMIRYLENDTLILYEECYDCYSNLYIRKK